MSRYGTNDLDIRTALHAKHLRRAKSDPETLVIDELGLAHAKCRIDVAVINGCIHGYEIKSAKDTLERLSSQIEVYQQTLQKLTIVAAPKHVSGIMCRIPSWCGVVLADRGARGGISFHTVQNAHKNPEVDPVMMAHLLWHSEVAELLMNLGHSAKELRKPRKYLYQMLCETMTLGEITASIRDSMVRRQAWRDHQLRA